MAWKEAGFDIDVKMKNGIMLQIVKNRPLFCGSLVLGLIISTTALTGCIKSSLYCPSRVYVDVSGAESFESNAGLPFRFPLDNISSLDPGTQFAASGRTTYSPDYISYHAAEDYPQEPGTPVYAMANGVVSYSGTMGGYGWLVVIDHPEMNLYSLYGHLSPSRWHIKTGVAVDKGQLVGHLGDSDENGGSAENPLTPHLHFSIRTGQIADYPSMGEWRWQAGWIKYCPQELGWLQPSVVITNQEVPSGGFSDAQAGFLEVWWFEFILSASILIGALASFIYATRKGKPALLLVYSAFLGLATWFSLNQGLRISYGLLTLCACLVFLEGYKFLKRSR